ncbi:MAG: sigma-70 family RNA polymerase sigma factor [Ignavibacteriaceae bacterium]|nr:sigma-70 family RNA polymerase sigma factor [Ignavibacteriaceae bacterium]
MNKNKFNEDVQAQTILTLDDDFSLIKRFNNGDETALRTLVSRHKDKVRNLIYLTLGNTDAIDDISQDVFVSVYRKLKTFRFESQFTTWLYRITVNKCRDHLRKIKIRSIFSPFTNEEDTLIAPEQLPDDFDIKIIVRQAIAKLPEKLKVPLILKDFDGLSYQEISETMGVEIGTIKSRIFRAREGLKKILAPYQKELL